MQKWSMIFGKSLHAQGYNYIHTCIDTTLHMEGVIARTISVSPGIQYHNYDMKTM